MKKYYALFAMMILFTGVMWGQVLQFEFSSLGGSEATANSYANDANLTSSTISRGAGLTASANGGRFNATSWALTTIANAVSGNDYMEFTITPNSGYQFSVSSIYLQLQRSSTGPSAIAIRNSVDGYTTNLDQEYTITDGTSTQNFTFTFTQSNSSTAVTYRIYMYAESDAGSGGIGDGIGDDLVVYGSTSAIGGASLLVSPSTFSGFNYVEGSGPSSSQTYNISGSGLTPSDDDITVTGSTNYEVSTDDAIFSSSVNVAYTGGTLSETPIYLRLKAGAIAGTYNDETITNAGGGATTQNITASGIVYKVEPTNHSTSFGSESGSPSHSSIILTWLDASSGTVPDGYLIKASATSFESIVEPVDGTAESNGTLVKNISQSTQTSTFSSLGSSTTYYFKIFPYTNSGSNINYKTDGTVPSTSLATTEAPPVPNIIITEVSDHSTYAREYVEIFNAGATSVDLTGLIIKERYGANTTDERSMELNTTTQKNTGGVDYMTLTSGEYAIFLRSEVVETFKAAYSVGNNIAIFMSTIPQMNGNERYQLETSISEVIDNFGDWDRSVVFEVTVGNNYERINGASSDGELSSNWQLTANASYTYTPGAANTTPLPVELTSFTATAKSRGVELAWSTATEVNNYGFEIERKELNHRSIGSLNQSADASMNQWNNIGFVEGHGTTNAPKSYMFVDGSASGTVVYRLKQIDRDGSFEYSNQIEVTVAAPKVFALMQNHPNPFNPTTAINYTLPVAGHVTLKIYDMLGKEVATLVNGVQDAGVKIAQFNASQLPSGIYFYTLRTNTFSATKKMLLVK